MRLATLALALGLAGCMGGAASVPPDNYYRLSVAAPAERLARPSLTGVLSISDLDADGLLRARPVLFTEYDTGHALRQHNYHFWADSPTRLLHGELVSYLRRRGIATTVVTPRMRVRPDYELIGKIKRLERVLGTAGHRAAVELELAVIRQSDRRLLVEDTFGIEVACEDDSVEASVAALNTALSRVFEAFAHAVARSDQTARQNGT